ncbi:MAG: helix-turn-helix domain-containing protein [Flavisolibacter sp.]
MIRLLIYFTGWIGKSKKTPLRSELDVDEQLQRLGKRIKNLRIEKGYTSYEYFAYEHNISRAQFGRYEQGQDLRFSSLIRIVNAFGMTLEEFFGSGF